MPETKHPRRAEEKGKPIEEIETLERPEGATAAMPLGRRISVAASRAAARLEAGQLFGSYRLIGLLGQGGFGQVWEAESVETGRRLALKVLTQGPETSPEMLKRFEREGRLAASLNHPHCVYVLGAETIEGFPTIAMELMAQGTLQDLLKERGPLRVMEVVDCALDILEGLEAAHTLGILHRDLKPSNCFLDETGHVKIGDFGLSKSLDVDTKLTVEGSFMGTPSYAAPEQVRGASVDFRADLYAFGATLYALLTGHPPFEGRDLGAVLSKILTEEPTSFENHGVRVPRGLQKVILRLLAKDPERRYGGLAALRVALLPFSSGGLTASGVPRRLGAFLVDLAPFTILKLVLGVTLLAGQGVAGITRLEGILFVVLFLYFSLTEARWGRSPGKALFGLRVSGVSENPVTTRQMLVRTAVFLLLYQGEDLATFVRSSFSPDADLARGAPWLALLQIAGFIALFAPMRRRNGFAGLHELASGTRVRIVGRREAVTIPASEAMEATTEARGFGPFEPIGTLWDARSEGLFVARDPALKRLVWIHRFADATEAPALSRLAQHRPGRLRWLQGGRGAENWDAYEAPGGTALEEWVARRGSLTWREMREVLLGVARMQEAMLTEAEDGRSLSLSRLWIDAAGRSRLVDFPVSQRAESAPIPLERWRRFLHQVLLFGLEGRCLSEEELGDVRPRAAFPEHARPLIERICRADETLTPSALAEEVRSLRMHSAELTRPQRLAALLIPVAVPLGVSAFALLLNAFLLRVVPDWVELFKAKGRIEALEALQERSDAEARETREAIRVLLAASHARARGSEQMRQVLAALPGQTQETLEAAARDYPNPTEEEISLARQRTSLPERADARYGEGNITLRWSKAPGELTPSGLATNLLHFLGTIAPLALLLSPFFRGGFILYLLGLTVQKADGRRAGRGRCLLRSLLTWSPFAVFLEPLGFTPLAMPGLLFALVGLAGAAYAAIRPERGLQDILLGTRLVPR